MGKVQEAIKASQLYLRLLETSVREELRRLLAFMATAAHPESCPLQKQVNLPTHVINVITVNMCFFMLCVLSGG